MVVKTTLATPLSLPAYIVLIYQGEGKKEEALFIVPMHACYHLSNQTKKKESSPSSTPHYTPSGHVIPDACQSPPLSNANPTD